MNFPARFRVTFPLVIVYAGQTINACAADSQAPDPWSGHISYVVGYKMLESQWEPVERQLEFGLLDADFQPPRWPVSFCTQLLLTYADDVPAFSSEPADYSGVWEINLGLRKIWNRDSTWQPFVGGGFSVIGATTSKWISDSYGGFQVVQESEATAGAWIGAGLYWNFSRHWHVGVQAQYSWGELNFSDANVNAGGVHALAMFGFHW